MQLLENKWVRIIGIGLVLYFALFANKDSHRNSLGNRLSVDRIKHNAVEVRDKSSKLIKDVIEVRRLQEEYNAKKGEDVSKDKNLNDNKN